METVSSIFLAVWLTLSGLLGIQAEPELGTLSVLKASQGGSGIGTAAPSDVGKVLKVSDDSPFTFTLQDDNTGAGGSFPWTPASWGNSTSTVLGNTLGFFANGSSTFNILRTQHATSTNLDVTGLLTFNGVTGSTWASFCTTITGSASLCDGNDATGGAGGTTVVSTSSSETSGRVPFWTTTSGTPAQLSGGVAGFAWNDTFKRLTATYASSTTFSATTIYGALVGNADTATALAADPANCSSGNAPLGIVASGAVEGCFDVWTEAENTSAGYVAGTRALTIAGTANQISSSAGSQNLTADRTWTLSLPNHVIFPSSYFAATGSTTNATSTQLNVVTHLRSEGTTRLDQLTSALVLTGSTGIAAEYAGASCTNQVIEDLDAVGSPTCRTITSAHVDSTISTFAYPFTPATSWFSTSTISLNTAGLISTASSSIAFLDSVRATSTDSISTNATTSALRISNVLSFGGVAGDAWTDFCVTITGSAGLCDGNDGGGGGSTDTVLWANASTSPWSVLSLTALSSSTIHKLNNTYTSTTQATVLTSLFIGDGQAGDDGIFFNSFAPNSSDYELRVLDQTTVDSRGLDLSIIGAAGNGIGSGGDINVAAGGGGSTGTGGGISITSGDGGVTSGNGGTFDFIAGSAQGSGTGGGIQFSAGSGVSNAGGAVSFFGGAGTLGGDIFFAPGDGSSTDGSVQIYNIAQTVTAAFNVQSLSTNRVFTFPDSSGTFCLTTTCAAFGYPFTPATSWTATSTLMLNTGGFMSVASSTLTNLFSNNLSIASDGTLVIPASASPVVNAAGEIALDTTSGNIIFATSTAQSLVLGGATTTLYHLTIASTSPDFASGGIIPASAHYLKQQVVGIICSVDGGTSQQIFLSDGTNDTNTVTCGTTETQYNITTNNIWNAMEAFRIEFGTKSGSPDYITIRVVGFRYTD